MTQIQGANSAQYSLAWLFSAQQAGATSASAALTAGGGNAPQPGFDPSVGLPPPGPQAPAAGNAGPPFSLDAMSALIAAQESSGGLSADQQKVFSELDTNGDGKVTTAELETDFGPDNKDLADAVAGKLDTDGDGSISESEFGAGTRKTMRHHHAHHGGGSGQAQGLDALMQATQAASTQIVNNSDGSSTTTLTYADGSTVTLTNPAAPASTDNSADSSSTESKTQSNLLEQLIKLQAQLTMAVSPTTAATV